MTCVAMETNTLLLPSSHRFCEVSSSESPKLAGLNIYFWNRSSRIRLNRSEPSSPAARDQDPADVGEMTTQTGVQSFTEAGSCAERTTQREIQTHVLTRQPLGAPLTSSRNLSSTGRTPSSPLPDLLLLHPSPLVAKWLSCRL